MGFAAAASPRRMQDLLSYLLEAQAWAAIWMLDETSGTTMRDATGNGRTGTYSGTFTLNQGSLAPNGQGSSVRFEHDGAIPKGKGAVPTHATLDFTTAGTIFATVNGDTALHNPVICKDECVSPQGFGFHWNQYTPLGYTRDSGAGTQVLAGPTVSPGNHLTAFRWRADRSSIWVDDAEVAFGAGMVAQSTAVDLLVGANGVDACGDLADLRLSFVAAVGLYVPDSVLAGAWERIQ